MSPPLCDLRHSTTEEMDGETGAHTVHLPETFTSGTLVRMEMILTELSAMNRSEGDTRRRS